MRTTAEALLVDLDGCVIRTESLGSGFVSSIVGIIQPTAVGRQASLEQIVHDVYVLPLDRLTQIYNVSAEAAQTLHAIYSQLEVQPPGVDVYPDFAALVELRLPMVLVTTGFRRLQSSKVSQTLFHGRALAEYFVSVKIDSIDDDDHPGKENLFKQAMIEQGWRHRETWVIGDGESECAAGAQLGLMVVQVIRSGFVVPSACADYVVPDLFAFASLCGSR